MNRLTEIANQYNTDKGTNIVCDNGFNGHGFTEFYYDHIKHLNKPTILEIGIWKGASTKMFNEFFNCECEIYCIDIDPNSDVSNLGDNVHFYVVDQGNEEQLRNFVKEIGDVKFDIILDDGSHQIYHQMLTYSILRKLLKKDGMYIMEDLHTSFSEFSSYNYGEETTTLDFFAKFVPYHRFSEELNHILFNEIKTVILFNNCNNSNTNTRVDRSLTCIIKLKENR
jgi:hypothetical protein